MRRGDLEMAQQSLCHWGRISAMGSSPAQARRGVQRHGLPLVASVAPCRLHRPRLCVTLPPAPAVYGLCQSCAASFPQPTRGFFSNHESRVFPKLVTALRWFQTFTCSVQTTILLAILLLLRFERQSHTFGNNEYLCQECWNNIECSIAIASLQHGEFVNIRRVRS